MTATGDTAHLLRVVGDAGRTAGPAFLVTETLAVTASATTGTASRVTVETVPGGPGQQVEAVVVAGAESGVVLLELVGRLPGTSPARLTWTRPAWGRPVEALGFPDRIDTGAWVGATLRAADSSGRVQLDPEPGGYGFGGGLVGAAVRDATGGVLGMIGDAAGTLIPTRALLSAVARLAGRPELARPRSPFRGLAAYGESDGAEFHARGRESAAVVELLRNHRWVSVVGDSGSGKSSLIRAGVIPVLRARGYAVTVIEGSARRAHGDGDLLERVLRELASPGDRRLVVLDQVEEILAAPDGGELLGRVAAVDLPSTVRVVLAMRPDALGTLLGDRRYARLTSSESLYTLSPLDVAGLRTVLDAAGRAVPVGYEDGLVDLVVRDVASASTPMPMLGYLMERLWEHCWDASAPAEAPFVLTKAAYHSLGGVAGAIGRRAERVWAGLDDGERAHGRRLLRRLVDVPDTDAAPVRRTVARSDTDPAQWRVAQLLATERLLGIGGGAGREVVEVVHEVLLREWGRYARWIDDDRAFLLWRAGLTRDVARWEKHGRDDALLPGDATIGEADVWERFAGGDLDDAERGFLDAGRAARHRRARARRWRQVGVAVVTVAAVVLATLGGFEFVQARENRAIADSHALVRAAQGLEVADPSLAVMTALAAYRVAPTRESRNQLMRMYGTFDEADRLVSAKSEGTQRAYSRDGDVVLEWSSRTMEVLTGVLSGPLTRHRVPLTGSVRHAQLAADGRRVIVFRSDGSGVWFDVAPERGAAVGPVRDLPDPAVPRTRPEDGEALTFFGGPTSMESLWGWSVNVEPAISADGRHVAARVWGRIVVWDLAQGAGGAVTHRVRALDRMRWDLWFGADPGTLIARVDDAKTGGDTRLVSVDVETGAARDVTPLVTGVAVSGDRSTVVTCRVQDGRAVIERYRAADGTRAPAPYVLDAKATCPSSLLVDAPARLLYLRPALIDLERREVLARPGVSVAGEFLIEHDGTLYGTATIGDAVAYVEVPREGDDHQAALWSTISGDGTRIYTVLGDGRLSVRSLAAGTYGDQLAVTGRLVPHWKFEGADHLEFDATGTRLLERAGPDVLAVRDARTLELLTTIRAETPRTGEPPSSLFDPAGAGPSIIAPGTSDFTYFFDGHDVVTVSDTTLQRWDATTGGELARLDIARYRPAAGKDDVRAGRSPRPGTVAVTAVGYPDVSLVDVGSGEVVGTIPSSPDTIAVQFDDSGRYMALLLSGSILELWRLDPLRKEVGPLPSISESTRVPFVAGFAGSDGTFVLGTRNTVSVYGIEAGGLVDSYYFGHPTADEGVGAFMQVTRSLSHVIRIRPDGTGGPLSLDPAVWRKQLCEILGGRDFTDEEIATLPGGLRRGQICVGGR
ncbi:nSTAND1 domain-containing NTPase [Longispora urticae]